MPCNSFIFIYSTENFLKTSQKMNRVPPEFICPITNAVMNDPVSCTKGHNFELDAIAVSLFRNNDCPVCKVPIEIQHLVRNDALNAAISAWRARNAEKDSTSTGVSGGTARSGRATVERRKLRFVDRIDHLESYDGEVQEGTDVPHGQGVGLYEGDRRYEGKWRNGVPHGPGKIWSALGGEFSGLFRHGTPNGHGVHVKANGSRYEGEWKDGMPHGEGKEYLPGGVTYFGAFHQGNSHGFGVHTSPSGTRYEGEWRDGMAHGKGKERLPNGEEYTGPFVDGVRHGRGFVEHPNGFRGERKFARGYPV